MPMRFRRVLSCRRLRRGAVTPVTRWRCGTMAGRGRGRPTPMRGTTLLGGTLTPAALAWLLLLAGCTGGGGPEGAVEKAASIVGPVWTVEEIAGAPVSGETPVTLQLGANGKASGRGGCNSYGGPYTLAGDAIRFSGLAATRMACAPDVMDQEQRYFDTLAKVERYAVADDGALLLGTGEGKEIRLRRE